MPLDARDLRRRAYSHILARGMPPTSVQLATHFAVKQAEVLRVLREMKIGKAILVHPSTGEIWMAGPFASSPTQYKVIGRSTQWWANCAWDMLGVASLVGERVRIETECADCGEGITLDVNSRDDTIADRSVVHFLIPAERWYDDIGFT